jgi:hypothetical protein
MTMPLRVALDPRVAALPPDLLEYYTRLWDQLIEEGSHRLPSVYCATASPEARRLVDLKLLFSTKIHRLPPSGSWSTVDRLTLCYLEDPLARGIPVRDT